MNTARSMGILELTEKGESQVYVRPLTDREAEVLMQMDAGLSNHDIAEKLQISYHTVAWYVRQIFKKLDVSGRTQAVAVARSLGLLGDVGKDAILSKIKHNLPMLSPAFIGREEELVEIEAKLKEDDCRLLTLLGPGGSGKTRLGIEAARRQIGDFQDGVFFVNLAPIQEAENQLSAIAAAIRFSFYGDGTSEEQLLDYLRNKTLLLLLDNFEQLLEGATFVVQLVQTAPNFKILVTSRTSLSIIEEQIFLVKGLSYPEASTWIENVTEKFSAVKLFESRARRILLGFELTEKNILDVVRICQLVEGLPLGVILAANWMTMLSPAEIAVEISQDLAILETTLHDLAQRQRSMYSVFNYSWRQLSEDEREIMRALSVFRGGFTRDAAQKIASASLIKLKSLTDQSMLPRTMDGRYEIHELVRQYASEKMGKHPVIEQEIREKFSDYFCNALASWEHDLQRRQQAKALKEIALEIDNIRTAWIWAVEKFELTWLLDGINGLCMYYDRSRQRKEGQSVCESLVEKLEPLSADHESLRIAQDATNTNWPIGLKLHARALAWNGFFNMRLGNLDRSYLRLKRCLSILNQPELAQQDTRFEKALAYLILPFVVIDAPQTIHKQKAMEAVELFKSLDEPWWVGVSLSYLGSVLSSIGEEDVVEPYFYELLAVQREIGDLGGLADTLMSGSYGHASNFQFKSAEVMLSEALAISMELTDRHKVVSIYGHLGWQWVWDGRFEEARALYRQILATHSDLDYSQSSAFVVQAHIGYPDLYLGEYTAARSHASFTIDLIRDARHFEAGLWKAYNLDILGKVALAKKSYPEAEQYFLDSFQIFQTNDKREKISGALACLGFTYRAKGKKLKAQHHLCQAFSLAIDMIAVMELAHVITGIALLLADFGDEQRAIEFYASASSMGIVANSRWFADIAGDEMAEIAAGLPDEIVKAAKGRARTIDSWETAGKLLIELEEVGWGENVPPTAPNEFST